MQRLRLAFGLLAVLTGVLLAVPGPLVGVGEPPAAEEMVEAPPSPPGDPDGSTVIAQTSAVVPLDAHFEVR